MLTQKQGILEMFKQNGGKITLTQILSTQYAAEYRARFTDLRKDGFRINLTRGKKPSQNTYELVEPVNFDESGQGNFI